ncbi:MAG: protein-L-isoaspartate(D-aspartate) O-methyltransferase [candidate division Zixibacteria bacterium]|nr:protein-L-isoaspartate(D-aspartate) O-methyltransferase [candidate division Zixibacteria bacterium]
MDRLRLEMVEQQLIGRGISSRSVLDAFRKVERHRFVPDEYVNLAYTDQPLPIGWDQTISQPYIVALMTELLALKPTDKALEIGTGSGYQAAILAELIDSVFSIEIVDTLAKLAVSRLDSLNCRNVYVRSGDGYRGWPEHAPFDAIIVTCAPEDIPGPLVAQLAEGGRMVIPVGTKSQELLLLTKRNGQMARQSVTGVRFVPMTGEATEPRLK